MDSSLNRLLLNSVLQFILIKLLTLVLLCAGLLIFQRHRKRVQNRNRESPKWALTKSTVRLCSVLGSGGHTKEMIQLLTALEYTTNVYSPRLYLVAETDTMSGDKIRMLESNKSKSVQSDQQKQQQKESFESYEISYIPRSREVGQNYAHSVFTTLFSFFASSKFMLRFQPDLLLVNGPGTCVPIVLWTYLMDLFCLHHSRIVFVESFCRVKSLSLTGRILRFTRMADEIIVQWPEQADTFPGTRYIGKF